MKKILSITLFIFLFLASNCFAATFTSLVVVSDNRASEWRFSANLMRSMVFSIRLRTSSSALMCMTQARSGHHQTILTKPVPGKSSTELMKFTPQGLSQQWYGR
jgi:hypothetical protein